MYVYKKVDVQKKSEPFQSMQLLQCSVANLWPIISQGNMQSAIDLWKERGWMVIQEYWGPINIVFD
jgi:hypothetical protein